MKSSTLHRSNLSRERMAVLDGQKVKPRTIEKSLGEYTRPSREKELDVLWQNFKSDNLAREKTPAVYLAVGFIAGVLCVLLFMGIFALTSKPTEDIPGMPSKKNVKEQKTSLQILPADQTTDSTSRMEKYTVRSGDTLDKIVVKFYGKYDPVKIKEVQDMNGMTSPNTLQIGQVLTIPIEGP